MSYNVSVALAKVDSPLPPHVAFGHTALTVTDSTGAAQTFSLTNTSSPPWTQVVSNLADGASSFSAQDVDSTGAPLGAAVTVSYTPPVVMFPASSGISITPA